NIGAETVLDLDTGDIIFGKAVANDDVLTLADIDARIGSAAHGDAFHQHIGRRNGIDAVSAVLFVRPFRPFDAQVTEGDPVNAFRLDTVALRILDREIFEHHIIGGDK